MHPRTVPLLCTLAVAGCGGMWRATPEVETAGTGVSASGSATVLEGDQLAPETTVLRAMIGRVPNLRVSFLDQGRCPSISLRNSHENNGSAFPLVYVDGTRASDTCILQTLNTREVETIEIYPSGVTMRPGYTTHVQGLILVFMRR